MIESKHRQNKHIDKGRRTFSKAAQEMKLQAATPPARVGLPSTALNLATSKTGTSDRNQFKSPTSAKP